jgi:hypothetical protein
MRDSFSKPITAKKLAVKGDVFNPVPVYARKAADAEMCSKCGHPIAGRYRTVFTDPVQKVCRVCDNPPTRPSNTFPFTTTHFNGQPTEVTSLHQLRKLEREYGVHCAAYANDEKNNVESPHYGKEQIKGSELRGHRGPAPQDLRRESIEVR